MPKESLRRELQRMVPVWFSPSRIWRMTCNRRLVVFDSSALLGSLKVNTGFALTLNSKNGRTWRRRWNNRRCSPAWAAERNSQPGSNSSCTAPRRISATKGTLHCNFKKPSLRMRTAAAAEKSASGLFGFHGLPLFGRKFEVHGPDIRARMVVGQDERVVKMSVW